jgi:hypothetical protein
LTAQSVRTALAFICAFALSAVSCRTTSPGGHGIGGAIDTVGSEATQLNTSQKRVESASQYSDLRLWEKLESKNNDSPARSGLIRCNMDHAYISCVVEGNGGGEILLESTVSTAMRMKMIAVRTDLEFERRIIASASCDKVDATVPPYTGIDAKCRFEDIRAYNEALIDGDLALEFSSMMRGENSFGDKTSEVSGFISCAIRGRKVNVNCTIRPVNKAGITNDARSLTREDSVEVSEKMIATLSEIKMFVQKSKMESDLPSELAGSVRCLVVNHDVEQHGKRTANCQVRM